MTALSKRGRGYKENQKFENVAVTACRHKELMLADGFALFCQLWLLHTNPQSKDREELT